MKSQTIQLQNPDGSHRKYVCQAEIDRLVDTGEAFRLTRRKDPVRKYRLRSYPEPSNSPENSPCILPSDTRAVIGMQRVDEIWLERLIGFGLVPENTPLPAHGYL